ncbi:MAG: hypothetical protein LAO03_02160 [Acidobacteriia bacterium]|nr:hypothetical protein [Terriglobia bacterium]
MELQLSPEEAEVVWDILADRHRELLREISRTSHHEFKITLRHREAVLDAVIKRLSVLRAQSYIEALAG